MVIYFYFDIVLCTWSGGPAGPEFGNDHVEDGDEEEGVGGQEEEDGHDVDPLRGRPLDKRTTGEVVPVLQKSSNQ